MSKLLQRLKEDGLLGCLDGTGITSENYKEFFMNKCTEKGCRNLDTRCLDCGRTVVERVIPSCQEWISIEKQDSPIGKTVLLCITYPKGTIFNCRADPLERTRIEIGGRLYNGNYVRLIDQFNGNILKNVTHWMPLPRPPEEEI
jgi:hypothetical protein